MGGAGARSAPFCILMSLKRRVCPARTRGRNPLVLNIQWENVLHFFTLGENSDFLKCTIVPLYLRACTRTYCECSSKSQGL
jgi:hypothetical protein